MHCNLGYLHKCLLTNLYVEYSDLCRPMENQGNHFCQQMRYSGGVPKFLYPFYNALILGPKNGSTS